jgi:hypothetical protein
MREFLLCHGQKLQIPNTNILRAPEKSQAPNFKQITRSFDVWSFSGAWFLEFGAFECADFD